MEVLSARKQGDISEEQGEDSVTLLSVYFDLLVLGILGNLKQLVQVKLGWGGGVMENANREEGEGNSGGQEAKARVSLCRSGGEGQRLRVTGSLFFSVCTLLSAAPVLGGRGCELKRLFS